MQPLRPNNIKVLHTEAMTKFNIAFGLMTIIPLLICIYLVTVKFFSIDILIGPNGAYFLLVIVIALLGLLYGRGVIQKVVRMLAESNTALERAVAEEATLNGKLKAEISMREKAQERLRTAQDQLIQAAKMESVGQLAAGAAHEVKNPLAVMSMGLDYFRGVVDAKDEQAVFMLTKMENAVQRADGVIRGLLDFASLTELTIQPENLQGVLERSLGLVKHEVDKRNIEVRTDFQRSIAPVPIDANRIEQVFVNLITNAVYAMAEGGCLTVRLYTQALNEIGPGVGRRADDSFRLGETAVIADILDTGHGIPEKNLGKIFDPFFTTRRQSGGTGLGLSIVKNLVDMHQGYLLIENRKEGGAMARVMLKTEKKGRFVSENKKKILIIDDEEDFGRMVAINLEKSGLFQVRVEKLGSRALSAAEEFEPDLVLLDVMMRDMAGPAVARTLRQAARFKDLPIVFLSATVHKGEKDTEAAALAGHPCIAKPVQTLELIRFIERQLGKS